MWNDVLKIQKHTMVWGVESICKQW